jgi:serine/threonine-protein kinase RsbW
VSIEGGNAAPPRLHGDAGSGPGDLLLVVDAVAAAVPAARNRVRAWLDALAWPVEDAEDVELAVNEALANVVDHAYPPGAPGPATLHAWAARHPRSGDRRVVVTVTDRGRWAAYHPDDVPRAARGHGLVVMSGCMAELHIQRSAAGTTVVMISEDVPPAG